MKNDKVEAFLWRFYNTFKSVIFPVVAGVLLIELQKNPGQLDVLLSKDLWELIGYSLLISVLGSAVAGVDKLTRVE